MRKDRSSKKAQMTVEYLLLMTVILLALLWGMNNPIKQGLTDFFQGLGEQVGRVTGTFGEN